MRAIEASIRSSSTGDRFHPLSYRTILTPTFSADTLAEVFGLAPSSLEELVRQIFGRPQSKAFKGTLPRADLTIPVDIDGYEPGTVRAPIDWQVQLQKDRRWRLMFNGLAWVPKLSRQDDVGMEAAGRAILDYRTHLLNCLPIDLGWDDFTWGDHPLAIRANSVLDFLDGYTKRPSSANPEVVLAAFQILLTQLAAILDDICYTPGHNHGLFQDLALLRAVGRLNGLCHGEAIQSHAVERVVTCQLARSISREGAHVENSPEYHLLFAKLLLRALLLPYIGGGPPVELHEALDAVLRSLVTFVRPDGTLAPFGDSARANIVKELERLRTGMVQQELYSPDDELVRILDHLITQGTSGQPPAERDAVFESVGYACLRSDWRMDQGTTMDDAPVCVHVKCGSVSRIHKHTDDGSFQLYGLKQELIVDPAKFTNDRSLPGSLNTDAFASHNVFRIIERNGIAWDDDTPQEARLADWQLEGDSWVLCRRSSERAKLARIIVFRRPRDLVIVDLLDSPDRVVGQAQLVLHPSLDRIEASTKATGFRASRSDGLGISVRTLPVEGLSAGGACDGGLSFAEAPYHPGMRKRELTRMALIRSTSQKGRGALATQVRIETTPEETIPRASVSFDQSGISVRFEDAEPIRIPFSWS
ncbi:heparinase II/III family protein [Rubellimicrobium arenae]|uniref:heparinase II/III family protein n=1 Tax=Rubellimicrobium arenae TaxID=2817372 RepID=UPI001B3013A8|nr:heparinase II/III family protein [Rubellimicrobium arenae]